mmetsp:Transcript_162/g.528  ORF Transcript_162/g.528 Transcript_162/m.528 type:complete len:201 (-) Transcript_162:63-665(-)
MWRNQVVVLWILRVVYSLEVNRQGLATELDHIPSIGMDQVYQWREELCQALGQQFCTIVSSSRSFCQFSETRQAHVDDTTFTTMDLNRTSLKGLWIVRLLQDPRHKSKGSTQGVAISSVEPGLNYFSALNTVFLNVFGMCNLIAGTKSRHCGGQEHLLVSKLAILHCQTWRTRCCFRSWRWRWSHRKCAFGASSIHAREA